MPRTQSNISVIGGASVTSGNGGQSYDNFIRQRQDSAKLAITRSRLNATNRMARIQSASSKPIMQPIDGMGASRPSSSIGPAPAAIAASTYRSLMNWTANDPSNSALNSSMYHANRQAPTLTAVDFTLIRYYSSSNANDSSDVPTEQPKLEEFWSNGDRISLTKKKIHASTLHYKLLQVHAIFP